MNTVKIGDDFENKSYDIIEDALNKAQLGIIPNQSNIYRKKGYYNASRKDYVIFDLSIEVQPPKANKPSILYIIECKSYSSKNVPVDDMEEFMFKINGLEGFSVKGVMVSNNKFSKGAKTVAENNGVMLIEVDEDDYNIILYRNDKNSENNSSKLDDKIKQSIETALLPQKIDGLKKLSAKNIDDISVEFLNEFNPIILKNGYSVDLNNLCDFLKDQYSLDIIFANIADNRGNQVLGYFDNTNNKIYIDKSITNTVRFPFTLAHEVGHFILHKSLKANQATYNNFRDSHHNLFTQKHELRNDKNWLEWQANQFAASLLMPKVSVMARLLQYQNINGIRNKGRIYFDAQKDNQKAYYETMDFLSSYFNVSKLSLEFRLNEMGILKSHNQHNQNSDFNYLEEREKIREDSIIRANTLMNIRTF